MNTTIENQVRPLIAQFVADQNGRYREHCSDTLLEAILIREMRQPVHHHFSGSKVKSRGEALLQGDINVAYEAACPLFENLLEGCCGVRCNGHHVAQHFASALNVLLPAEKSA